MEVVVHEADDLVGVHCHEAVRLLRRIHQALPQQLRSGGGKLLFIEGKVAGPQLVPAAAVTGPQLTNANGCGWHGSTSKRDRRRDGV
jgi:hypothetical protein